MEERRKGKGRIVRDEAGRWAGAMSDRGLRTLLRVGR